MMLNAEFSSEPLLENEAHLRSLMESAVGFAIYRVKVDPTHPYGGKIVLVSPSLAELIGTADPYRFECWFENIHPDDLPGTIEANKRAWENGETYNRQVRVFNANTQTWKWVHTISNPVLNEQGKPEFFNGLVVDITSIKEAEAELQKAYQNLEQRIQERTRELVTLFNVQQALTSRLNLDDVLQMIADEARRLTGTRLGAVYLLEEASLRLAVLSGDQEPGILPGFCLALPQPLISHVLQSGQAVRVTQADPAVRQYVEMMGLPGMDAFILAPLLLESRPVGLISVADKVEGAITADDERVLNILASSAVIALENARLYEEAEQTAALAERNRLARELHDAVTQTLFSASLIGDVLPRIWEDNPEDGRRRLADLRRLTRGALAEMRSLLMELRPQALESTDIEMLLRHLAEAFRARGESVLQMEIQNQAEPPVAVKIVFYRIIQEALNNIARHAEAEHVTISLKCQPGSVHLEIQDDGCGFIPEQIPAGHLGVGIMRERAASIGAALIVDSKIGQGTRLTLSWP